jgi:FlaA1/EpsC-like NDP-sugar epimerase
MLNIDKFISEKITFRNESFFKPDFERHHNALWKEINGKSALIIGGAGTIGSSFIKALLKFEPSRLFVIDINENGLTELTRDLRSSFGINIPIDYKTYPINFDDPIMDRILENEGPFEIIANFAAHKHVRSEKDAYSIAALIDNNVFKAERLLAKLVKHPPQHFFCVSTDKAANPANIMGASKKIMEEVIMSYSIYFPVTTARFANVAFSNGSLLYGFIDRLMKRQPFSAPSDVKRYFVSPEESGQICLLASVLGHSGEIFFPKLKEESMLTFSEISNNLLAHLGYKPYICSSEEEAKKFALSLNEVADLYPVYYFESDTSGEKAIEEFFVDGEKVDFSSFVSLGVIKNTSIKEMKEIQNLILSLKRILNKTAVTKFEIVEVLQSFLPDFKHIETGKNLDQKM